MNRTTTFSRIPKWERNWLTKGKAFDIPTVCRQLDSIPLVTVGDIGASNWAEDRPCGDSHEVGKVHRCDPDAPMWLAPLVWSLVALVVGLAGVVGSLLG